LTSSASLGGGAKVFRKGTGYLLGLILFGFMFLPLLGFGDAKYHRPVAAYLDE
jgi:hypothetical protein